MSGDDVRAFLWQVEADETLRAQLMGLTKQHDSVSRVEVARLATAAGFS